LAPSSPHLRCRREALCPPPLLPFPTSQKPASLALMTATMPSATTRQTTQATAPLSLVVARAQA
jgi:hypothetical protein